MAHTLDDLNRIRNMRGGDRSSASSSSRHTLEDLNRLRGKDTNTLSDGYYNKIDSSKMMSQTYEPITAAEQTTVQAAEQNPYRYNSLKEYDDALANMEPQKASKGKDVANTLAGIGSTIMNLMGKQEGISHSVEGFSLPTITANNLLSDKNKYTTEEREYKNLLAEREKYSSEHAWDEYKKLMDNEDFAQNITSGPTPYSMANKQYGGAEVGMDDFHYLSKEQEDVAKYIYNTQGKEAYDKYVNDIYIYNDRMLYNAQEKALVDWSNEGNSALKDTALTAATVPGKLIGNLGTAAQMGDALLKGRSYNPYGVGASFGNMSDDIREEVSKDIEEATPNAPKVFGQNIGSFAYNTGLSMVDSTAGALMFGEVYTPLMGASAFSSSYKELKENGASDEQATVGALASGVAEAFFERFSIDNLVKAKDVVNPKTFVKEMLKQAGIEASEETFTEITNILSNSIIMGTQSDIQKRVYELQKEGYSDEEIQKILEKETFNQIASATLGGFLSGGGMGGAFNVVNYYNMSNYGSMVDRERLSELNFSDTAAEQRDSLKQKYGEEWKDKAKNAEIGSLYNTHINEMTTKVDKAAVDAAGEAIAKTYDISGKDAQAYAKALLTGENTKVLKSHFGEVLRSDFENNTGWYENIDSTKNTEIGREYIKALDAQKTVDQVKREKASKALKIGPENIVKNEKAKIISMTENKDGSYTVETSKGTFKSKDVTVDQNTADALTWSVNIADKDLKEAYVANYGGEDISDYDMYARYLYEWGKLGADWSEKADKVLDVMSREKADALYNAGMEMARKEISLSAEQLNKVAEKNTLKKGTFKTGKLENGRFVEDKDVYRNLSNTQKRLYQVVEAFAKIGGVNVQVINDPSEASINGEFVSGNNVITINLAARPFGDSAYGMEKYVISTLSHELTHWMKANDREAYDVLEKAISDALTEKGTLDDLIKKEQDNHKKATGKELDRETALEEVVARACEDMLNDSATMEDILSHTDAQGLEKLREAFKKWFDHIRQFLDELMSGFRSPNEIAQSLNEEYEELKKLWTAGIKSAMAKQNNVVETDTESGTTVHSVRYTIADKYEELGYKSYEDALEKISDKIAQQNARNKSELKEWKEKALKWLKDEESIASIILGSAENMLYLDYEADERYKAIKDDTDYPQGTVDLSNLCRKRELFTRMFDRLQKDNPNILFTAENIAAIRQVLTESGYEVACALCYVEDRRQRTGEIADAFIKSYSDALKSKDKVIWRLNSKKELKKLITTIAQAEKYGLTAGEPMTASDKYIPTQYDLTTYEGFKALTQEHPTVAAAFENFNKVRGQGSARLIEGHAEYKREILEYDEDKVKLINSLGGLRIFSFSDFEAIHLIDIAQVIMDCASKGIKVQAYTKVPAFANLVKNSGIKLNRSLIPANVGSENAYAYVDGQFVKVDPIAPGIAEVNGKKVLCYDTVEGIDVNDKNFLDMSENRNIGNICIGVSEEQIKMAMEDPFVDYIIPFHSNQSGEILHAKGIADWANYKLTQLDKNPNSKKSNDHGINIYTDVLDKYTVKTEKDFVEAFLKECKKQGYTPRFAQFLNTDEKGNYVYTEGYYKMLLDYKLFDKNGNILPQEVVRPDFDLELMNEILMADKERSKNLKFDDEVVDKVKEKLAEQGKVVHSLKLATAPIEEDTYKELKDHFGTTTKYNVAGYMLKDGTMLDFSGKHWGDTTSTSRQVDHRDVQEVIEDENNGVDSMVRMIANGNIRLMPENGGINLSQAPTVEQTEVLKRYIRYHLTHEDRMVVVDFDEPGKDTVYTLTYDENANESRILDDIRNYFRGAKQSELAQFHKYSIKQIIGPDGKDYGIGVQLDSPVIKDGMSENEAKDEVIKFLDENVNVDIVAYDSNNEPVYVKIKKRTAHFKNHKGVNKLIYEDLLKKYSNITKYKAITLINELAQTSSYQKPRKSKHSHGWLDNNGKNDWNYWIVYIQDTDQSVWKATLNVANSVSQEKILYDIDLKKITGQTAKSVKSLSKEKISDNDKDVKRESIKMDSEGRELTEEQAKFFKDSRATDESGHLLVMYHGTPYGGFTEFKKSEDGAFFFTSDKEVAKTYSGVTEELDTSKASDERYPTNYAAYLNAKKPLVIDAEGAYWFEVNYTGGKEYKEYSKKREETINKLNQFKAGASKLLGKRAAESIVNGSIGSFESALENIINEKHPGYWDTKGFQIAMLAELATSIDDAVSYYGNEIFDENYIPKYATREIVKMAREEGYDSVIFKNIVDVGIRGGKSTKQSTVIAVFNSNQIKTVQNDNPTKKKDIRYSFKISSQNSEGKELTEGQQNYFKKSKVRDDQGRLKVMYHGTGRAGFTTFEISDDGISFFFTDNKETAESYSGISTFEDPAKPMSLDALNTALSSFEIGEFRENNGKIEVWIEDHDKLKKAKTFKSLKEAQEWFVDEYVSMASAQNGGYPTNYEVYLNIENPLVVDAHENLWDELEPDDFEEVYYDIIVNQIEEDRYEVEYGDGHETFYEDMTKEEILQTFGKKFFEYAHKHTEEGDYVLDFLYLDENGDILPTTTREYAIYAKEKGYDGVIFNDIIDTGSYSWGAEESSQVVAVFNPNQIKSVYNENPTEDEDIRHSYKFIASLAPEDQWHVKHLEREIERLKREKNDAVKAQKKADAEIAMKKAIVGKITEQSKTLAKWLLTNPKQNTVPQALRKPIAELLTAIDYTTSSRQWRERNDGKGSKKDQDMAIMMGRVRHMLGEIDQDMVNDPEAYSLAQFDWLPEFTREFDRIQNAIAEAEKERGKEFTLQDMEVEDLTMLNDLITALKTSVTNMNRLFGTHNKESVSDVATEMMEYLNKIGQKKLDNDLTQFLEISNTTPYYFFKRLGPAGQRLFKLLQDGLSEYAFKAKAIEDFAHETFSGKDVKKWRDEVKEFKITEVAPGDNSPIDAKQKTIKMTVPQIMSLYCLSKRDQALRHISTGGIKVSTFTENGKKVRQIDNVTLSEKDLKMITDSLTDEQKEVADKLQEYMSTVCARWGNEVTMKRFGYKGYTEKHYFPINVDTNVLTKEARQRGTSLYQLLNMGFTKPLNPKAKNPIEIFDIFETFTIHATDMAQYNSLALPVLDVIRVWNFKELSEIEAEQSDWEETKNNLARDTGEQQSVSRVKYNTVKGSIDKAIGEKGNSYIGRLLADLNGDITGGRADKFGKKLIKNYKTAAVAANIQVALLQPLSYLRAGYAIDPKYLEKALTMKSDPDLIKKYCGIAVWKDMGFYNTAINNGLEHMIMQDDSEKEKVISKTLWLAGKMDELTWRKLWLACELEVRDTTNLKVGTEEYYEKVADRLTDLIYATQVVDSILTRSELMRGADLYTNMVTAFNAEPTLGLNILMDAAESFAQTARSEGKQAALTKNGKQLKRAAEVYILGSLAESILRSVWGRIRNYDGDDDDESLIEEILTRFLQELDPFRKIPIIKDVWGILWDSIAVIRGKQKMLYTDTRMDEASIEQIGNAMIRLSKAIEKQKVDYKTINSIAKGLDASGLPVSSTLRIFKGLWNNTIGRIYESMLIK